MSALATRHRAAAATRAEVAQATNEALKWGNAVDAVAAGLFAAAAAVPTVLLGPVQWLLGGRTGLRAVDGRTRQPGLDAARPRGFVADEDVAAASRVGVPAFVAAVAAAVGNSGSVDLARTIKPSFDLASANRRRVLERIAQLGPPAIATGEIASELIACAGKVAGGLLGTADLERLLPVISPCTIQPIRTRNVAFVPWQSVDDVARDAISGAAVEVVAAVDMRGRFAIACYEAPDDGVAIDELGLVAPFTAAPVRRGEPRVTPGEPRPRSAPILISEPKNGSPDLAFGIGLAADADARLRSLLDALDQEQTLDVLVESLGENAGRAFGVFQSRDGARTIAGRREMAAAEI